MKVSRKVGTRSRCFSSISRKKLKNKNRKHAKTQNKKNMENKVGGHKRARTYKRGNRIHKGGKNMPFFGSVDPATLEWDSSNNNGTIKNLKYIKIINEKQQNKYDNFSIVLSGIDKHTITLTKIKGESQFSFSYNTESKDSVINELYSAIKFGHQFINVEPVVSGVTYKFHADENFATLVRDELKK